MQEQQVTISRTYTFPAVPFGWDWVQDDRLVALFDDAGDRYGSVIIGDQMLQAAAVIAAHAIDWQAAIDAEAAQAPVIEGQPVYVAIPLALRRKGWAWKFGKFLCDLLHNGEVFGGVIYRDMTRQQVLENMADLVSDAEVQP